MPDGTVYTGFKFSFRW
jgi:uncharacterized protein YprB with RNaseH-like and TPR domain